MLKEIGLTDYYFKELLKQRPDYLLFLINNICGLKLQEKDIIFGDSEERGSITFKTINYDIKIVSNDLNIDIEAQKKVVDQTRNENGEYEYDISRAMYYLSILHSRIYSYKEKGYNHRRSIVIFIYNYEIPGDSAIQQINMHNRETKVEYDNLVIYAISLEKIPENSKIELERALKMLQTKKIEKYLKDESNVIKEAATMLKEYDETEKARIRRDNLEKEAFERNHQLNMAEKKKENEMIQTMYSNGFDVDTICRALSLEKDYVKEILDLKK